MTLPDKSKLHSKIFENSPMHRRTGNFLPGGGGEPFAQKILASCPNFYEKVEKTRGSFTML